MENRAVSYVRVSTKGQVESGLGLDDQRKKIEEYCKFKGLDLIETFVENGVSASIPFCGRPAGEHLLRFMVPPKGFIHGEKPENIKNIVILKLDRAFRNCGDCLRTLEDWDKKGYALHIIDHGGTSIDTSSATGKFMITMMAGMAEWERNVIRERTRAALAIKRLKREKLGGSIPYGWSVLKGTKTLVPNKAEQEIIKVIISLRNEKEMTLWGIVRFLEEHGIPMKTGKKWHPELVRRIVARNEPIEP